MQENVFSNSTVLQDSWLWRICGSDSDMNPCSETDHFALISPEEQAESINAKHHI